MELTDVFQNTESPPRPRHQTKRDNQNWEACIKTLNHFSPNEMRIALFFACDGGAGAPQITNNFEKHQSAPGLIFHRGFGFAAFSPGFRSAAQKSGTQNFVSAR